ncbi:cysteine dioxygenase [Streptomyces otsuchiensis]|uniref:cysteine dioxygenase n=1 Tax=Streptomyces otsuchiensis TaxID=2681388 RepID=UPI001031D770|nr:cysteine dioxygenase family protein [Streptomyces otsuchiensis]
MPVTHRSAQPSLPAARPAHSPASLSELARRVAARTGLWKPLVRFTEPERFYVRLEQSRDHEVWLLTWLPGQGTDIHNHGGSSGAFTVVDGALDETTFRPGAAPARPRPRLLGAGALRSFGPRYVHEVVNRGTAPAVSVHAYSPALTTMSYYRHLDDGTLVLDRTEGVDR